MILENLLRFGKSLVTEVLLYTLVEQLAQLVRHICDVHGNLRTSVCQKTPQFHDFRTRFRAFAGEGAEPCPKVARMRSGSAAGTGSGRAVGRRMGGRGGNRARKSWNCGVF